jgi:poly(beta-D-mannuronate) lyase
MRAWAVFAALAIVLLGHGPAQAACSVPEAVVRNITAEKFYSDPANSIVDPAAVARNAAALRALDADLKPIVRASDQAIAGDEAAAQCALALLVAEARGQGMLGVMGSTQAQYERKWRTAGVALAYLKVRRAATPEQQATIEPWLLALARNVERDYGAPSEPNNHYYWAGLVAGAVGTATGDRAQLAYARAAYLDGLDQIRGDGALPRELARRSKALHYHAYALAPLIVSAELAAVRGEDWYALRGGAIHRLVARTRAALADPEAFARLAGVPSVEVPTGGILGWLAFYRARFPERGGDGPPGPFYYDWLGGDLSLMATKGLEGSGVLPPLARWTAAPAPPQTRPM